MFFASANQELKVNPCGQSHTFFIISSSHYGLLLDSFSRIVGPIKCILFLDCLSEIKYFFLFIYLYKYKILKFS